MIVDEECRPLHAMEYQGGASLCSLLPPAAAPQNFKGAHDLRAQPVRGTGEHGNVARDAVKKEALRRAGIDYVEVVAGDTPAELRRVVERLVREGGDRHRDLGFDPPTAILQPVGHGQRRFLISSGQPS